jgi:hypothetical protein
MERLKMEFAAIETHAEEHIPAVREKIRVAEAVGRVKSRRRMLATFVTILLCGAFFATVQTGALDRFPAWERFGEWFVGGLFGITQPVNLYSEYDGIRFEIISAARFGWDAVVFFSVTDTTGQNRLTEDSRAWRRGEPVERFFQSGITQIGFDAQTNTAYFELIFNDWERGDLRLDFSFVEFSSQSFTEMPFPLALSEAGEGEFIEWGMRRSTPVLEVRGSDGGFPPIPGGAEGAPQWISGFVLRDDMLHVQIGGMWQRNVATLRLADPYGLRRGAYAQLMFARDSHMESPGSNRNSPNTYEFREYVFQVDASRMDEYALTIVNYARDGLFGNWELAVSMRDASSEYFWRGSERVGDVTIEYVLLSPMGVRFGGVWHESESGGLPSHGLSSVRLELPTGTIDLQIETQTYSNGQDMRYRAFARTDDPIPVQEVIAVIAEGRTLRP